MPHIKFKRIVRVGIKKNLRPVDFNGHLSMYMYIIYFSISYFVLDDRYTVIHVTIYHTELVVYNSSIGEQVYQITAKWL